MGAPANPLPAGAREFICAGGLPVLEAARWN
jgi:hypothetical protein